MSEANVLWDAFIVSHSLLDDFENNHRHPPECSDEERSTWSGGTITEWV